MFRIPAEFHGHTIFFGRVFKDNVFNHVFMWAPVTSQVTHLQYLRYGDIVIFVKCKLQQLLNEEEFQHNFFFKTGYFLRHYTIKELPKLPSPSFKGVPGIRNCVFALEMAFFDVFMPSPPPAGRRHFLFSKIVLKSF